MSIFPTMYCPHGREGPVSTVLTVSNEAGVLVYVMDRDGTWWKARLALPPDFRMPL